MQTHHTRVSSYSSDIVSTQQKLNEIDAVLNQKLDIAAWERARRDDSRQLDALLLQMTSQHHARLQGACQLHRGAAVSIVQEHQTSAAVITQLHQHPNAASADLLLTSWMSALSAVLLFSAPRLTIQTSWLWRSSSSTGSRRRSCRWCERRQTATA